MKHAKPKPRTGPVAKTKGSKPTDQHLLRLYVAGASRRSRQAILHARELCAEELKGRFRLEVIDTYQDPSRAGDGQIVATPTLVKEPPLPRRRLIGTLAKGGPMCVTLGLDTPAKAKR